jgi:hypothetical protein
VIVWHLLADRTARYQDLGAGYYASRIDKNRKTRNHVRQLEALGYRRCGPGLTSGPAGCECQKRRGHRPSRESSVNQPSLLPHAAFISESVTQAHSVTRIERSTNMTIPAQTVP